MTKWRWMLFDVDFGFGSPNGAEPGSFDMMPYVTNDVGPDYPNGPRSTLLFRKLLGNPSIHADFINRFAVLLSWQFAPERVHAFIDSMQAEVAQEQPRDLLRWQLNESVWADNLKVIQDFASTRAGLVREHLRKYFALGGNVVATLSSTGGGVILVNGLPLPTATFSGTWFQGHELRLEVLAKAGKTFTGWSDGIKSPSRVWVPTSDGVLTANFQ